MNKILTPIERSELLIRHKTERDKRVADRIKAVILHDDGWSSARISEALLIDDATIRFYIKTYLVEKRVTPNHKGSSPLLTVLESAALAQHLEDHLYVKIKDIQHYVREIFQKELSVPTLYQWLQKNDFSYKKPKLTPYNVDSKAQEAFIAHYASIMNEASIEGDPVLFGDSVHPSQQTRASYGWIKRGKDSIIEVTSARKRINLMATLNLETMHFTYKDYETINWESAVDFLKKVEAAYPTAKTIHLIWDQAGYHTCKEVAEYLITSRVRVHFLPPRSPNLNSIERLWKIMHEYVSNNRVYKKFKDFKEALFDFFNLTMPNIKDELISRVTDNFRVAGC
jgi:transposase